MGDLEGLVVVVTGAAQGIGEYTARVLGKEGAHLLLGDIQEKRVLEVARSIAEDGGVAEGRYLDITSPESAAVFMSGAAEIHGRIDGLVSSAGLDAPPGRAWEISAEHWREVIDVDLNGTWWCIKAALPQMMEQRQGRIVVLSSVSARTGSRIDSPAYSAAKAGILGLTVSLAVQLEEYGILVNAIAPGPTGSTGTPLLDDQREEYLGGHPLGFGGPKPIADAVLYLLRSSGDWISGTVMNVSGGSWRGI